MVSKPLWDYSTEIPTFPSISKAFHRYCTGYMLQVFASGSKQSATVVGIKSSSINKTPS